MRAVILIELVVLALAVHAERIVGFSFPDAARPKRHVAVRHGQQDSTPQPAVADGPSSVVAINTTTASLTELVAFPLTSYLSASKSTLDAKRRTLHLLGATENGTELRALNLKTLKYDGAVPVATQCDSGSACIIEVHWDTAKERVVAFAIGWKAAAAGAATNAIVAIDPKNGSVSVLHRFSLLRGVYSFSSAFDSAAQVFYAWLGPAEPSPRVQLVAFSLTSGSNTTLLDVDQHNISSPCTFVPGRGLIAVDPMMRLVQISSSAPAVVTKLTGHLGGIPTSNGLVWSHASGMDVVYSPLVNFGKNLLVKVELGKGNQLTVLPLASTVEYPHVDEKAL